MFLYSCGGPSACDCAEKTREEACQAMRHPPENRNYMSCQEADQYEPACKEKDSPYKDDEGNPIK